MRVRSFLHWTMMLLGSLALACTSGVTDEGGGAGPATGSLSLDLVLDNGTEINQVNWEVTREGMDPMSGSIDTSAPGATASVEVFGLEPGDGYTITLSAVTTDETSECQGSADFSVDAGVATDVMVFLRCTQPPRRGAVRANGKFNLCAELSKMVVSPLETLVGTDIALSAAGEDQEGDDFVIGWTAEGGTLASETGSENTFTCGEGGGSITASVSDDGFDFCSSSWTVEVTCISPALVRVGHLAPEIPTAEDTAVDIFINGERSPIQGLTYAMATSFVPLPPGDYEFGIAPAGGEPIFSFPASLSEGSITTVVAIRSVNSSEGENPVGVLAFDGDVSGLGEGEGGVSLGHGLDEPVAAVVDGIETSMCPPPTYENLMFGTTQGPVAFDVGAYSGAVAIPGTCEPVPPTNAVVVPAFDGTATLVVAVDLDVNVGMVSAAAYALIGNTSGEIPTLPAVGAGGTGGAGGEGGAGGAGGEGGSGGSIDPEIACDENACALIPELKEKCESFLTACLLGEQADEEECVAVALLICSAENVGP